VMNTQVGVPRWISGIAIAVLTWLVIIGGIKSIGRAFEKLAPAKVGIYLVGSLVVIVTYASRIPDVLAMVFREAFTMQSALGFGMFTAIRYGLARGLYANEAGYGTAAVAYGTAQSSRPAQQGLNAVMETFIVSFGTCSLTALTVMLSGVIDYSLPAGERATSTAAVGLAFNSAMPGIGGYLVLKLSPRLVEAFSWRGALQVLGIVIILLALPLAYFVRDEPGDAAAMRPGAGATPDPVTPMGDLFRAPAFYLLAIGSITHSAQSAPIRCDLVE